MKTVLVHNVRFGGAHRRMSEQLQHLDLPVTEVTLEGADPLTDDPVIVPMRYRGDRPRALALPITRYLDLLSLVAAYRRLHETVRQLRPDVIWLNPCRFLQTPWLTPDLAGRAAYYCDEPRRADYDAAARHSTRLRTRVPYWPLRRLTRHLDRATATVVGAVATNSSYSAGQIQRAYGCDAVVVPCGVSSRFRPSARPGSRDHLLSVGTLIPSKGHDLAIEAAGRSGLGLPVVVVAPREDPQEEGRLHRIAGDAGVSLAVKVGVTDGELVGLYQSAVVTLYMARSEPFGLVSIEAQACGSPVIVSDEGGLPETIIPDVTGWAVPRRAVDVASRLAMLTDRPMPEEMEAAAVANAATWSWDVSASRLRGLLSSVARP